MQYLYRKHYLSQLFDENNQNKIKVIQGIYASGKSLLLFQYVNELFDMAPDARVIYIDCSLSCFSHFRLQNDMYEYVEDRYVSGQKNYLIIDEIQLYKDYAKCIHRLYKSGKYEIIISSSVSIVKELNDSELNNTEIAFIPVYPVSFSEYCALCEDFDDKDTLFEWYIAKGGFAGAYKYQAEFDRINYINNVYMRITGYGLNDRYHVQDIKILEKIQKYLIDNISKTTSPNKLSDNLKARGISANHVTTGRYINYLLDSFLFYELKRLDLKSGNVLETMEKYYIADLGLIDRSMVKCVMRNEQIYENLVFFELYRRGYTVYTGKIYQKEIDFVALKGDDRIYIQVIDNMSDLKRIKEIIKPMISLKDAYPKILISRTKSAEYTIDGVKVVDIAEWLYQEKIY